MARTSSICKHFIIWPSRVTFNLPDQMFQMAFLLLKENNCAKLFWNPSTNVQVMAWTKPDGRMHAQHCTHACIYTTEVVKTMSHAPQVGLTKIIYIKDSIIILGETVQNGAAWSQLTLSVIPSASLGSITVLWNANSMRQEGHEALNRSPEWTGQRLNSSSE